MKKRIAVLLAPGAEEMETTIIVDVLRRAALEVVLLGVDGVEPVTCSRGVRLVPDASLEEAMPAFERGEFDAVVLPGGNGGAERLAKAKQVGEVLSLQWNGGRLIGAICAAPVALVAHGIAKGKTVTCYPTMRPQAEVGFTWSDERVVDSGQLVTSQGPGTTFEFALTLIAKLVGPEVAERVRGPLLLP